MLIYRQIPGVVAVVMGVLAGGCASNPLSLPPLPASLGADAQSATVAPDPPVDVYSRVARGALKCWFGSAGSLKKSHVFHAKTDPPSAGGAAQIVVHTRDAETLQPGQAGYAALRAFQISISPAAGGSLVETQNVRFPEPQGLDMTKDVARWVGGSDGCSVLGTGGWAAAPASAVVPAAPGAGVAKKAKTKVKTKPSAVTSAAKAL